MFARGSIAFLLSLPIAAQTLVWPGEAIATIDARHLRAYVPAASAASLRGLVARADQIYAHMQNDAGFVAGDKLRLLIADWFDDHNGYSFVVPFPLVQLELAPAHGPSTIFAGGADAERTLIHEFAHQISNDRNHGLRGGLESVFGRIVPNDLLSLLVFYLSTPAHQTQPRFWQEGLAIWAETAYADPQSAWCGRGRDPLTHMVWRLDAAAGGMPQAADWRITWHQWPFGGEAYSYGAAYTRFLAGAFGSRASMWRFVQAQAKMWPFLFDRGARGPAGERHQDLLARARQHLFAEQTEILHTLRAAPVTVLARSTPDDMLVGAPAWRPDGSLVFAGKPAQDRARLYTLSPTGALAATSMPAWALSPVRALPDDSPDQPTGLVHDEFNWRGIRRVAVDGDVVGWRLMQPDAGPDRNGDRLLVAIQLRAGGGQELVAHSLRRGVLGDAVVVPTQGTPWTPALRRGSRGQELVWVETDAAGSRLVLGSLDGRRARTVLWSVRGRILHPVWSHDGATVYCCADHTGVANAYRIDVGGEAPSVRSITNTIGGVVACVPSPDGQTLALVDHDARGPFVATRQNDPALYAATVPTIPLAWPAPGEPAAPGSDPRLLPATPIPPLPADAGDALVVAPYSGLGELRPRFWAPSTFAVPEGGYGVFGLASDPLFTHVVQAGAGAGLAEQEPVGFLGYDYLALPIEFGVAAGRSERTFAETVTRGTERLDYTETVAHGAVRAGRGLFALERTFLAYVSLGVEDHDEVDDAARQYVGGTYVKAPFRDTEQYVEATLGYDDSTFYPTSYAREDGVTARAIFRHSGFGGELTRNRALCDLGYSWSVLPKAGHQVIVRGQLGWSDGDDTLQGNFSVGGGLAYGLPRGYLDEAVATGRFLLGGSLAYRFPAWRPFAGGSTGPFRGRQLVVELFVDSVNVDDARLGGGTSTNWFSSAGVELFANSEFMDAIVSPGVGVAYQFDGERDVRAYFSLGFSF